MQTQFNEDDEQRAGLAFVVFDLMEHVGRDLDAGIFDDDPDAREQAEALHADARSFYVELLPA
ncbi:MAG: hypothetical protein ACREAB_07265 [Blastocatellia bacterium]